MAPPAPCLIMACGLALALAPAGQATEAGPKTDKETGKSAAPANRPVSLIVPLKDGTIYLGDIDITITPDGAITLPPARLIALLRSIIGPDLLQRLETQAKGQPRLAPASLAQPDFSLQYDPRSLELRIDIAPAARTLRHLRMIPGESERVGTYETPASFSAYLNLHGAAEYHWNGVQNGFKSPSLYLDGATRAWGVVAESQQYWQPGRENGPDLQRLGSRLVIDDRHNMMRWMLGDLRPVSHGFQLTPQMAGIGIERIYSAIDPQSLARPRGGRSFLLARPSTVEVYVNDRLTRRLELAPGNYNLSDFPFAQGGNKVRLRIQDDSGQAQDLRFSLFLDQAQLGTGRSEFGLYAGVHAPMDASGPDYTQDWEISGFYRRGISDNLTLEASLQADRHARMLGVEGLVSLPVGIIGFGLAGSTMHNGKAGYAAMATYQYRRSLGNGRMEWLQLSVEKRSDTFTTIELPAPNNPYAYELAAHYTRSLDVHLYGGISARYSKGSEGRPSVEEVRGILGWQFRPNVGLNFEVFHEKNESRNNVGVLLALTVRLSPSSLLRGDFDSRTMHGRVSYQGIHGDGVGAYNLAADVETMDSGRNASFTANYITNRASLGMNHYATFDGNGAGSDNQRTAFRLGTALAFADGAFSIGRPITNGFAIITPHKALGDAPVLVDATPYGTQAKTGVLGSALQSNLSPYSERSIGITAPEAEAGTDLGKGAYRLFPPYRAGYRLKVGSDYNISAMGTLRDADGLPVALATGQAVEAKHPDQKPIMVFTDRNGRFALSGLRAGVWRIEMQTQPPTHFEITIPPDARTLVRMGDIQPEKEHGP